MEDPVRSRQVSQWSTEVCTSYTLTPSMTYPSCFQWGHRSCYRAKNHIGYRMWRHSLWNCIQRQFVYSRKATGKMIPLFEFAVRDTGWIKIGAVVRIQFSLLYALPRRWIGVGSALNYESFIFEGTFVKKKDESLQRMSKVESTGKLPVDFATRVFIQILEGCVFLNEVTPFPTPFVLKKLRNSPYFLLFFQSFSKCVRYE